jgi:hypothetical protein
LTDILVNEFGLGDALAGWTLQRAVGVSGDGRSITGWGLNPAGNTEAWIAYLGPAATLLGDYNNNGAVDAADYVVWRNSVGQTGSGLAADSDASGTIDAGDYNLWRASFGRTAAGAAAVDGRHVNGAIPEPSALVLIASAVASINLARRRRLRQRDFSR